MDFHKFPINQSIIHTFLHNGEERQYCLKKVYLTKISRQFSDAPSDPMMFGRYFESQILGKSARGQYVDDLPRKKITKKIIAENAVRKANKQPLLKGDKFLHQIRIDEQVNRFKALCKQYRVIITDYNVQVPILTVWDQDPDILLSAELDIFPTTILLENELNAAIIDIKLTSDIHNDYGEYSYGKPEFLDLIQAKMYHYIVRNINEGLNPHLAGLITDSIKSLIEQNRIMFLLWVFNYKGEQLEDKFIKVLWDSNKESELHESIRKTKSILEYGEANDWPTNSEFNLCKNCPFKDCPDRAKIQTI
jgi:hypothetical protein